MGELAAMTKGAAMGENPLQAGILAVANLKDVPVSKAALPAESGKSADTSKQTTSAAKGQPAVDNHDAVAISKSMAIDIPAISPSEKATMRANLPPLYEGDQYALEELETRPKVTPASASRAGRAAGGTATGVRGTDADLDIVTSLSEDDDGRGAVDFKLPPELAAILEASAKKLNQGLSEGKR
jgi:hypothetical protein